MEHETPSPSFNFPGFDGCGSFPFRKSLSEKCNQKRRADSRGAGQADLSEGDRAFEKGNDKKAIEAYQRFHSDFPRAEETPYVLLRIGRCYFHQQDCDAARMYFEEVLKKFPKSPEAVNAAWGMARCAYNEGDCRQVRDYLEEYRKRAEGRRWEDMTMMLAQCAVEQGDELKAVRLYARELKQGETEKMRQEARKSAEKIIEDLDDDSLEKLLEEYPAIFPGDYALLQLVRSTSSDQDYEKSSDLLVQFEDNYPDSPYYHELIELKEKVERRIHVKSNRIGVLLPLSGNLAQLGEQSLQGAMMAAHIFDPGGIKWAPELVIKDTARPGSTVEALVEELVKDDEVVAIIGPLKKSRAYRAAKVAQDLKVPYIALSSGENIVHVGEWVYQNHVSKTEQVKVLLEHSVTNLNQKKFGVLYPNIDFGREYLAIFTREAEKRGAEVVASASYDLQTTDFKKEIRSLRRKGIEGLFIPDFHKRVVMIAPQIRYYLLSGVTLLGISNWHHRQLLEQTQPEDLEESMFTDSMAPEAKRPLLKTFQRNFRDSYGSGPGVMEVRAYEAVDVLVHLINNYRVRDRIQLKKSLDHVEDHPGVTGPISVDVYGKWRKPVYLYTIMDGEFIVIWQTVVGPEFEAESEGATTTSATIPETADRP